jgi:hypothetical protein
VYVDSAYDFGNEAMLSNLSKAWALPAQDKWLLAQSLVVLAVNGLALRVMSFKQWQAILSRLALLDGTCEAPVDLRLNSARKTATMVRMAATRGPYRWNCLHQSLTIWWLLRRQKLDSDIRFGARKADDTLEAHAWVEFDSVALNDGLAFNQSYAPFERLMTADGVTTR